MHVLRRIPTVPSPDLLLNESYCRRTIFNHRDVGVQQLRRTLLIVEYMGDWLELLGRVRCRQVVGSGITISSDRLSSFTRTIWTHPKMLRALPTSFAMG
jgi:hypothetical protein